ncbi:SDR family oxidoreductase [Echinicola vietnamensis]|uniref:Short-chain dehydrogenase, teichoic and lipoteichoic acid D-alanine esterification n=1 Tax=Echinicola vietnamensis (strain DSM 17526 / LMG 23754 / KMM 6221) TaxID=926556 RepID=L0FZX9_ECHVK|nr:SDR family NAD(P)-dependent oxidoreductase [Echinicola vietnamensis]AGA78316.1 short-chain dehydrogenase, teichoic and lipoteichoic acid D-alanine esterification [Echinicola vietnamensis DSM 17526]
MKLQNQTILITGGSSGIGLELTRRLAKENQVLICGRSMEKLAAAERQVPGVHAFSCDLSQVADRQQLFEWVRDRHPDCNVLINNAALVHRTSFQDDPAMIPKMRLEVETNLMAPMEISKLFLPLLESKRNAQLINITSGLVYAPKGAYPIYNATKAALHSFTQTLRLQLRNSSIRIREVLLPVVDTPWHQGEVPKMAISAEDAVTRMLKGLETSREEIRIGKVKLLYVIFRLSPKLASAIINQA